MPCDFAAAITEVPIGDGVGVASGNFTSSLKFVFYVNGQAVDVETFLPT